MQSSDKPFQTTAIIIMTANMDIETAVKAMQLGAVDYIVKPFTIGKLNASIITALKKSKDTGAVVTTMDPVHCLIASNRSLNRIDAIAFGVDAQVDYFDFHSKIVTERTVGLAQELGLPDWEIENWIESRNEIYSNRDHYIKSIICKLEGNIITQSMLGLAHPM